MSEFRVDTITDRAGTGRPNFPNGLNIEGNNVISNSPAWSESGTAPTSLATENRIIAYNKGGKNLLINGNMMIHQRISANTSVSVTTEGYFTADRWITEDTMDTAVFSQTIIDTDSPTTSGGQEFRKVLRMTCTTAKTSLGTTDAVKLVQRIEGQNLQVLKKGTSSAESITVSFWVKSNISATYIVELEDPLSSKVSGSNGRQISKSYTTTANTWTKQTLTFVGDTASSGTLINDNLNRLQISFWLVAGASFTNGSLNSNDWQSITNGNRAVGQTNFASANTNTFFITGIQMEVGSIANPYEYKSYSEQLALCRRYYRRGIVGNQNGNAIYFNTYFGGSSMFIIQYDAGFNEMRTSPNLTLLNSSNFQYYSYGGAWTDSTLSISNYFNGYLISAASDGDGRGKLGRLNNQNNVFLEWVGISEL